MKMYTRNLLALLAITLLFTACASEKQLEEIIQQSEEENHDCRRNCSTCRTGSRTPWFAR